MQKGKLNRREENFRGHRNWRNENEEKIDRRLFDQTKILLRKKGKCTLFGQSG
jgi:hypothetical protein